MHKIQHSQAFRETSCMYAIHGLKKKFGAALKPCTRQPTTNDVTKHGTKIGLDMGEPLISEWAASAWETECQWHACYSCRNPSDKMFNPVQVFWVRKKCSVRRFRRDLPGIKNRAFTGLHLLRGWRNCRESPPIAEAPSWCLILPTSPLSTPSENFT